jgi:hypothetical protein
MGQAIAVARLEAALAEQAQLAEQHDRATGTASELAAFARLQAANLRVAMCRRALQVATARRANTVT